MGQAVHIGDMAPPAGVEVLGDKHISVLAVSAPISEAEEAAATAVGTEATTGEPEVIKEKKEEGEGEGEEDGSLWPSCEQLGTCEDVWGRCCRGKERALRFGRADSSRGGH